MGAQGFEHSIHPSRRAEVAERVQAIFAQLKGCAVDEVRLADGDDFLQTLRMDSMDAVELTIELDAVFDIRFGEHPDDVDHLATFGSLIDLVMARGQVEAGDGDGL